jgi:DNA-binding XRE family transcriptional regulator
MENPMKTRLTPRLTKAARVLVGWSQDDLARHSGMSKSTIGAFEAKPETASLQIMNNKAVLETLERAGLVFTPDEGQGRGLRIGKPLGVGSEGSPQI